MVRSTLMAALLAMFFLGCKPGSFVNETAEEPAAQNGDAELDNYLNSPLSAELAAKATTLFALGLQLENILIPDDLLIPGEFHIGPYCPAGGEVIYSKSSNNESLTQLVNCQLKAGEVLNAQFIKEYLPDVTKVTASYLAVGAMQIDSFSIEQTASQTRIQYRFNHADFGEAQVQLGVQPKDSLDCSGFIEARFQSQKGEWYKPYSAAVDKLTCLQLRAPNFIGFGAFNPYYFVTNNTWQKYLNSYFWMTEFTLHRDGYVTIQQREMLGLSETTMALYQDKQFIASVTGEELIIANRYLAKGTYQIRSIVPDQYRAVDFVVSITADTPELNATATYIHGYGDNMLQTSQLLTANANDSEQLISTILPITVHQPAQIDIILQSDSPFLPALRDSLGNVIHDAPLVNIKSMRWPLAAGEYSLTLQAGSEQALVTVGITGDADFIQLGQFVTVVSQKEPVN